jgi:aspartyl-tRNA(Asn)/glutamyl-tRNA(Gln) amidotransferase subunit B
VWLILSNFRFPIGNRSRTGLRAQIVSSDSKLACKLHTMFASTTRIARTLPARQVYVCNTCLRRARSSPLDLTPCIPGTAIRSLSTESQPAPRDDAPFRKQLKDAAKQKKKDKKLASDSDAAKKAKDARSEKWKLTVGIEIHAELNTARKLFSSAATSLNEAPNTHVAPFDIAFPGSQPHFQKETLIPALRAALALNCNIQPKSSFDRKHYFYQDQPAGYQITQYYGRLLLLFCAGSDL